MKNLIEEWREIPNWPGYNVNEYGVVKSLARLIHYEDGRVHRVKERIKISKLNTTGYKVVYLHHKNKSTPWLVHRLVYLVFKGELIDGMDIDHYDNDKTNNHYSNLQQITRRENTSKDKWRQGKTSKYTGVCYRKDCTNRPWKAQIRLHNRKVTILGYFKTELEASKAYQSKLATL